MEAARRFVDIPSVGFSSDRKANEWYGRACRRWDDDLDRKPEWWEKVGYSFEDFFKQTRRARNRLRQRFGMRYASRRFEFAKKKILRLLVLGDMYDRAIGHALMFRRYPRDKVYVVPSGFGYVRRGKRGPLRKEVERPRLLFRTVDESELLRALFIVEGGLGPPYLRARVTERLHEKLHTERLLTPFGVDGHQNEETTKFREHLSLIKQLRHRLRRRLHERLRRIPSPPSKAFRFPSEARPI